MPAAACRKHRPRRPDSSGSATATACRCTPSRNAGGDLRQLRVLFEQAIAIDPQRYADETVALKPLVKACQQRAATTKPIAAPYRLELVMYQSQTVIGLTMASKTPR